MIRKLSNENIENVSGGKTIFSARGPEDETYYEVSATTPNSKFHLATYALLYEHSRNENGNLELSPGQAKHYLKFLKTKTFKPHVEIEDFTSTKLKFSKGKWRKK